jgi:prevent-host-death family protein
MRQNKAAAEPDPCGGRGHGERRYGRGRSSCLGRFAASLAPRFIALYILYMTEASELSVSDARKDLAAVIDEARSTHKPVWLSRRGHRVAAVVSADDLERLEELAGDMADILDAEEARVEMGRSQAEPIPWEQVKADLGLS